MVGTQTSKQFKIVESSQKQGYRDIGSSETFISLETLGMLVVHLAFDPSFLDAYKCDFTFF